MLGLMCRGRGTTLTHNISGARECASLIISLLSNGDSTSRILKTRSPIKTVWRTNIDDIYALVNYADTHWIAMWISIPKRHIVVFDSICSSISPKELDVVMEPFLYMVPYLLVECASSDEQRAQYSLEPFTYERPTNIPPARTGDCGVYTLKYIECHALGIEFSKKDFAKANGKTMRDKMVVDIFQELPDAHEFENKDNDANLGAYEG
ncbi:unnamed protein product [Brassica oleracea]